jgi:hypothetical protein
VGHDDPTKEFGITLLVSCELWNERNARVFKDKHALLMVVDGSSR